MKKLPVVVILVLLLQSPLFAAEKTQQRPGPKDKCPVCGMFVAKYPDFLARIVFRDNSAVFFDGPKDCFKFYLDPGKYLPSRSAPDIDAVFVTDYYGLSVIDARTAWYVIGSDVRGPMGRELIPFRAEAEAREFLKDHRGERIVRFREATAALLGELE